MTLLAASLLGGCMSTTPTRDEVADLEDDVLCARMYYSHEYGISLNDRTVDALRHEFDKRFQENGLQPGYCKALATRRVTQDGLI